MTKANDSCFLIPYTYIFDGKKQIEFYNINKSQTNTNNITERIHYFLSFIYEKIHSKNFCFGLSEYFNFCDTSPQKILFITENTKTHTFRSEKNFFLGNEEKIPPEYIYEKIYYGQKSDLWVIGIILLQNILIYANYKNLLETFKKPLLVFINQWDTKEMNSLYNQSEKIFLLCILNDLLIERKPLNIILNKYFNTKYSEKVSFPYLKSYSSPDTSLFLKIRKKYIELFDIETFVNDFMYFNDEKKIYSLRENDDTIKNLEMYIKYKIIPSFFLLLEEKNIIDLIVKEENLFFLKFSFVIKFYCISFLIQKGFFNSLIEEDLKEINDYMGYDIRIILNNKIRNKIYFSDLIFELFKIINNTA